MAAVASTASEMITAAALMAGTAAESWKTAAALTAAEEEKIAAVVTAIVTELQLE